MSLNTGIVEIQQLYLLSSLPLLELITMKNTHNGKITNIKPKKNDIIEASIFLIEEAWLFNNDAAFVLFPSV